MKNTSLGNLEGLKQSHISTETLNLIEWQHMLHNTAIWRYALTFSLNANTAILTQVRLHLLLIAAIFSSYLQLMYTNISVSPYSKQQNFSGNIVVLVGTSQKISII